MQKHFEHKNLHNITMDIHDAIGFEFQSWISILRWPIIISLNLIISQRQERFHALMTIRLESEAATIVLEIRDFQSDRNPSMTSIWTI